MVPEIRFHTIVLAITVSIMFAALAFLLPHLRAVQASGQLVAVIGWLVALMASVGTYRSMAALIAKILRNNPWLKRLVLGAQYVHGTWVGFYMDPDQNLRLIVEYHQQDLSSLVVRGSAHSRDGKEQARWTSHAANIDPLTGTLIYAYNCEILTSKVSHQGIAVFDFQRVDATSPPDAIDGYSADLTDGVRTPSKEKKISEAFLKKDDALKRAMEFVAANNR
jgi:hypothetical protein